MSFARSNHVDQTAFADISRLVGKGKRRWGLWARLRLCGPCRVSTPLFVLAS